MNIWSIFGLDATTAAERIKPDSACVHPDDRARFERTDQGYRGRQDQSSCEVEHRARHGDGSFRWCSRAAWHARPEGRRDSVIGSSHRHHRPPAGRGGAARERGAVPRHVRERRRRHRPQGRRRPLPPRQREVLRHRRLLPRGAAPADRSRTSRTPTIWRPSSSSTPHSCGANCPATRWRSATSARTARPSGSICPSRSSATRRASPTMPSRSPGHLRTQAAGGGAAAGQGGGGGGQPGQGRVPGQRQPRDPHAHERHPRHDRTGPRHAADRRPAAMPEDGQVGGRQPARHHQRPARLLQDRGRQAGAGPGRLLPAGGGRRHPAGPGRAGPQARGWSWSATCSRTCPTPWSATRAGCARCCSTWSATPSSSPTRARWSCAWKSAATTSAARSGGGRPALHRCATPASASRPTSRRRSSGPSSRRTPRPRGSTAAPAWA